MSKRQVNEGNEKYSTSELCGFSKIMYRNKMKIPGFSLFFWKNPGNCTAITRFIEFFGPGRSSSFFISQKGVCAEIALRCFASIYRILNDVRDNYNFPKNKPESLAVHSDKNERKKFRNDRINGGDRIKT